MHALISDSIALLLLGFTLACMVTRLFQCLGWSTRTYFGSFVDASLPSDCTWKYADHSPCYNLSLGCDFRSDPEDCVCKYRSSDRLESEDMISFWLPIT